MFKEEAIEELDKYCTSLMRDKGQDYGAKFGDTFVDDITLTGADGAIQRLLSKVFRIYNQLYQKDVSFEGLDSKPDDDIADLINYGRILLLLRQGQWNLDWAPNHGCPPHTYRDGVCALCGVYEKEVELDRDWSTPEPEPTIWIQGDPGYTWNLPWGYERGPCECEG